MVKLKLQNFGHLMKRTDSLEKDTDAGKDWGQEKRAAKDEMVGWLHGCNEHELGQTPGDGEGQGGLACCSPWIHTELDMTEQKQNIKMNHPLLSMGLMREPKNIADRIKFSLSN